MPGLELFSRGKVRDTFRLADGLLLPVATDGISIFDFVLNALVPMKGVILNAMNHFWLKYLAGFGFDTHFVAAGADIDKYLPEPLRNNTDLQSRAIVVKELKMADYEFVFRTCLTGSGLTAYKESGQVCGHKLPPGLQDGDELPCILDTPTTKAEAGHDEPVLANSVRGLFPELNYRLCHIVQIAKTYAEKRGIKLADTKFEGDGTKVVLGDEVLTPDSSRFWDLREWQESRKPDKGRKAPSSLDKQLVREWGKSMGIHQFDPKKPADVEAVHAMVVPDEIIRQTAQTYRYIFWRLTGMTIEQYLRDVMKVQVPELPPKNVLIICGSDADMPDVKLALDNPVVKANITKHVISCHRNPMEVMDLIKSFERADRLKKTLQRIGPVVEDSRQRFDVIIGVGSKALALPGVIDAWAHHFKWNVRVAGVALGEPGSRALLAAQLAIEELPGQPVIINEMTGQAYTGSSGLRELLWRVDNGELPPLKPRKEKLVQLNV